MSCNEIFIIRKGRTLLRPLALFIIIILPSAIRSQDYNSLQDSLRIATERLAFSPDSIDLRLRKAGFNLQLEQWQYAKEEYDKVLKKQNNNVAALFFRAYANKHLKRLHHAKQDYEHLLTILPKHFEARLGLALLCQEMGRITDAFDHINYLVEIYPDSSTTYAARAGMEVENNMYEIAELDISEAISREPGNIDYILQRALIRIHLNRKSDALDDLLALIKLGVPRKQLLPYFRMCKE